MANDVITNGVDLPWLQDTSAQGAQAAWVPSYRDVVIVDANNEQVASYNLTTHNLAFEENRNELKALLLETAEFEDADGDSLGDDWEDYHFGEEDSETAEGDRDLDRRSNFAEYSFGSDPSDPSSLPGVGLAIEEDEGKRYLTITFRRRLGQAGGLRYVIEESEDLENWTELEIAATEIRRVNPYDGTGTLIVTCRAPDPLADGVGTGYFRVHALVEP